jgi:hypothetical protein
MERSHTDQKSSFEERLAEQGRRLREQAKKLPAGVERNDLIRRARQTETASQINAWLRSPGLASPK